MMSERTNKILKSYSEVMGQNFSDLKSKYLKKPDNQKHHSLNLMQDAVKRYWETRSGAK